MKINFKKLIKYIFITFLIGNLFTIFVINAQFYDSLNKIIEVPKIVFPIVWTILYLVMAISLYIISESNDESKADAIKTYYLQLIVNSLWTLVFFGFKLYLIAFIWILLLIILVIMMIIKFYKINKTAGVINIPYLIWLFFAAYLNFFIVYLN